VQLIVDEGHLGQSEEAWKGSERLANLAPLASIRARRVLIVAPHPDDEVFGAGGLIQHLLTESIPLEIVAVTDGEGSHPGSAAITTVDLASARVRESLEALRRLGWREPLISRLHLPDSNVRGHRQQLQETLEMKLRPGDLCIAPWRFDGHPDHDVCGEASLNASRSAGVQILSYLVWTWHWADPNGTDIPWRLSRRFELSRRARAKKRWATSAFASQVQAIGPDAADAAILPEPLLRRFWRTFEVFIDEVPAE
jgi:LmbE family N-acetylglucosaminyl deacetylase